MRKIVFVLALIALFAVSASAIQVTGPTLGNDRQDRVAGVQTTVTITNNNGGNLTDITVTFGDGAQESKYALGAVSIPASIATGSSGSFTLNGTIPLDHPGIDSADLKEKALQIGTMTVSGKINGSVSVNQKVTILMQAVNQFEIKKTRVECDSKSESIEDGDSVENLKPGDQCTLEVEIENTFDDSDRNNQKIGDIDFTSITTRIESNNNDADVEEDDEVDELDANDEDIITADIDIEDDADDGNIEIEIRITARDENGALHGEALTFRLEVDRLTHDIQIRSVSLTPERVSACEVSNAKINVGVLNQGKRDEDEVAVEARSSQLNFQKKIQDLELDQDDATSVTFDVPVPAGTKEGVYRIDVTSFFDTLAQSNTGSVELTVDKCEEEEEPVVVVQEPKEDNTQTSVVVQQPQQGQSVAAPKKQESFTESKAYVGLLAVMVIVLGIAIAGMLAWAMRKKK